jgi:hypothetical protein
MEKMHFKNDELLITKQLYMPGCYARTLELDIVLNLMNILCMVAMKWMR